MAHNREKTFIFCQSLAVGDARLDKFLSERMGPDVSRARIQYLIKAGAVTVDNEIKKPSYQLKPGQTIKVVCLPPQIPLIESEDVDFDLLYEDNSVLIVDKPPGLVVHPAAGHYSGTLVHGLLGKCSGLSSLGGSWRPGIVHRLDKDTSGVMVVAKGNRAHHLLAHQFKKREVKKRYLALVHGYVGKKTGTVDLAIGRHPVKRKEMSVSLSQGREARTEWEVIATFPLGFSLLKITLHTGRTHQIRVHMAYIGYPIVGDTLYGHGKKWWKQQSPIMKDALGLVKRQMLHAQLLGFFHPDSKKYVEFESPCPMDMIRLLAWLDENKEHKC